MPRTSSLALTPSLLAPMTVSETAALPHTCNVPGCVNRALKACAHCGEARCLEHLLPTVDEQRGAVVHLCPLCMEARNIGLADEAALAHHLPDVFDPAFPGEVNQRARMTFDGPRADLLTATVLGGLPGGWPRERR